MGETSGMTEHVGTVATTCSKVHVQVKNYKIISIRS